MFINHVCHFRRFSELEVLTSSDQPQVRWKNPQVSVRPFRWWFFSFFKRKRRRKKKIRFDRKKEWRLQLKSDTARLALCITYCQVIYKHYQISKFWRCGYLCAYQWIIVKKAWPLFICQSQCEGDMASVPVIPRERDVAFVRYSTFWQPRKICCVAVWEIQVSNWNLFEQIYWQKLLNPWWYFIIFKRLLLSHFSIH